MMDNEKITEQYSGKHLVLLSGPMGSGHVRAAEAIKACAAEEYPGLKVTHINVAEYMSWFTRAIYDKYYISLLNVLPSAWRYIYKKTDAPPSTSKFDTFLKWIRKKTARKIIKRLKELKADYIVCTHFLPAEFLDTFKKAGKITAPVSTVVTDFDLHWIYVKKHIDHFFVSNDEVAYRLNNRGINKEKIHVTGIPIFPEFSKKYSKENIRDEFWLKQDKLTFLLMTGGAGVGAIDKMSDYLLSNSDSIQIIAMAGRNNGILESLQELVKKFPNRLLPVEYTNEMPKYFAASDIVVTKPGGISVSECLAMKKPLIVMNPIAGHEERNSDYLLEHSVALKAYDEASLLFKYTLFLYDSERLDFMNAAVKKISKPRAGFDILKFVLKN